MVWLWLCYDQIWRKVWNLIAIGPFFFFNCDSDCPNIDKTLASWYESLTSLSLRGVNWKRVESVRKVTMDIIHLMIACLGHFSLLLLTSSWVMMWVCIPYQWNDYDALCSNVFMNHEIHRWWDHFMRSLREVIRGHGFSWPDWWIPCWMARVGRPGPEAESGRVTLSLQQTRLVN